MKAIDPSEIITGEPPRSKPTIANPWARLLARLFDYALFFTIIRLVVGHIATVPPFEKWIPLEYLAWVPIEAVLLWTWGSTPGKWLLGIRLKKEHAKKLDFETSIRRSFAVWFKGIGMGIPIVNFFCLISAYHRLRLFKTTSWDAQEKTAVEHRPIAQWRFYLAAILAIIGLIYYSYWK